MRFQPLFMSILGPGCVALAQVSRRCLDDICYSLNIPDDTASTGQGDIYFQVQGPSSYSWIGLGQGSSMTGSRLFVVYASEDGTNVTVSSRHGTGHNLPRHDNQTQLTLLDGSGIKDGNLTANVRCINCHVWPDGGQMDFSDPSSTWIYAHASGVALSSDNLDAGIPFHGRSYGSFDWDFADAKGGTNTSPFVSEAATDPDSNTSTTARINADGEASKRKRMLTAHGVLACLAFVVFFPAGAISIRVLKSKRLVWIHAGMQAFASMVYTVAFGLGIYLSKDEYASDTHPTLGKVIFVALFVQAGTGHFHHAFFKRHSRRGYWSHAHLWLGRVIITIGIVNGGLGLDLVGHGNGIYIAYGIVAGLFWVLYAASVVYGEVKRNRRVDAPEQQYHREHEEKVNPGHRSVS